MISRWNNKYIPRWLGNDKSASPFAIEISRRTYADLLAFNDHWRTAMQTQSAEAWTAALSPYVRGPVGEINLDGEIITAGDTAALMRLCASEIATEGSLAHELSEQVLEVNGLGKAVRTNSAPSAGGAGTTKNETSEAIVAVSVG